MGKIGGYMGKILRVNLTRKKAKTPPLDLAIARKYIGGKALGARMLYDELKPNVDPLSSENKILLVTSPFTGTMFAGSAKHPIITKSPLTNLWLDSYAGGDIGPEFKYTGHDVLIIEGRSREPCYVFIDDENVEIKNARKIWGMGCWETEDSIKEELGDNEVKVMSIGPAGEKLVKFACITHRYYRQYGRGGPGAVFGSKNLKAIAVRGTKSVEVADPSKFEEAATAFNLEGVLDNPWNFGVDGTAQLVNWTNPLGAFPTRNFASGHFEKTDNFEDYLKHRLRERACFSCPTACGQYMTIKGGKYEGTTIEGPEYETMCMLGSNCGIDDLGAIAKANILCDNLGMDTITIGNVIAWGMECYEKGILTKKETGGIDLRFGNAEAMLTMIEKIAYREGLGELLAEGVKISSEKIGKGSEAFAIHVKGLELPGWDPRAGIGMTLAYATADRGGCHLRAWPIGMEVAIHGGRDPLGWFEMFPDRKDVRLDPESWEYKAELVMSQQIEFGFKFSVQYCDFSGNRIETGIWDIVQKALVHCTGFKEYLKKDEIVNLGRRALYLPRLFNMREGMTKKDELAIPQRVFEPQDSGPLKGRTLKRKNFEKALDEYYEIMGYDAEGRPKKETLLEVGIDVSLPY